MTVRATNGAGLPVTATSDGVTVDTSQPVVSGSPRDGLGADISYQTSTTTISANWAGCFSDPQSGIAGYESPGLAATGALGSGTPSKKKLSNL